MATDGAETEPAGNWIAPGTVMFDPDIVVANAATVDPLEYRRFPAENPEVAVEPAVIVELPEPEVRTLPEESHWT